MKLGAAADWLRLERQKQFHHRPRLRGWMFASVVRPRQQSACPQHCRAAPSAAPFMPASAPRVPARAFPAFLPLGMRSPSFPLSICSNCAPPPLSASHLRSSCFVLSRCTCTLKHSADRCPGIRRSSTQVAARLLGPSYRRHSDFTIRAESSSGDPLLSHPPFNQSHTPEPAAISFVCL